MCLRQARQTCCLFPESWKWLSGNLEGLLSYGLKTALGSPSRAAVWKIRVGVWCVPVQAHLNAPAPLWWQWWLLLSVSFPSGLCLGGSLFPLVCKATSSQYPKPPGTEKCLFLHQKQVSFLLTECFSLEKNNSEFRSCLHLFRIVNRISTVL